MKNFCKRVPAAIKGDEDFLKLTSKQLLVFYWLISKSYWEEGIGEDLYFLYRDTINYSQMGKDLGIKSNNTISNTFEKLKQNGKIEITENLIKIPFPKSYTYLHIDLIRFLSAENIKVGGDLLLFYSILKRKWELNNENGMSTSFGLKSIVKALGHNVNDSNEYKKIKDYIKLLKDWKLIEVSEKESINKGGGFIEYRVERIQEALEEDFAAEATSEQYSNLEALGFSILPEFSLFPSSTLEKLVSTFKLNELELKLYVICYRYDLAGKRLQYNFLTCGHLKEHLDYPQCPDDETILQALTSLNEKGLIEFGKGSSCRRPYDIDKSVEGWNRGVAVPL